MTRLRLASLLRHRLARDPVGRAVRDASRRTGAVTLLVGGYVRDSALGLGPRGLTDIDVVVTSRTTELLAELEARWSRRGFRFSRRGVTTWRFDIHDVRVDLVDAESRGLDADLSRRDLTVNAIAYDVVEHRIHDPLRGLADLRSGRLRMPREGVMLEDPLRAVRAARFLAQLPRFRLDSRTRVEARAAAPKLRRVAVERLRDELNKLLSAGAPRRGLEALEALGILDVVLPQLKPLRACRAGHDRPDVWTHTLDAIEISSRPARLPAAAVVRDALERRLLRWALLLHDVAKPDTLEWREDGRPSFHGHEVLGARRADLILRGLLIPRRERRRIGRIIVNHLRPGHLADAGASSRALRRLVRDAEEDLPILVLHAACDARGSGGPDASRRWRRMRTVLLRLLELSRSARERPAPQLLSGRDLIDELGLEPGPRIGRLLGSLRDAQLDGSITTRAQALRLAEELAASADDGAAARESGRS